MTELLEVEELEAGYDEALVLRGVSLRVGADQIVSIIGPNGAGKSTLFNCISGFVRADGGRILFEGARIDRGRPYRIARAGLVRTFQTPRVLTRMTVIDNVLVGAPAHPGEHLPGVVLRPRTAH